MRAKIAAPAIWLLATALAAATGPARAGVWEERTRCVYPSGASADQLISSCTAFIDSAPKPGDDLAEAYNMRGAGEHSNGDNDRALADFDRSLALRPDNAGALHNRGTAHLQRGDYDLAIADFDRAIKLYPTMSFSFIGRSNAWLLKGDVTKAVYDAERSVLVNPYLVDSLKQVCFIRAASGQDLERALVYCNKAMRSVPKVAAVFDTRALVQFKRGRFAEAISDADEALMLQPDLRSSRLIRGVAKLRLGQSADGQADIDAVRSADPGLLAEYARWGVAP